LHYDGSGNPNPVFIPHEFVEGSHIREYGRGKKEHQRFQLKHVNRNHQIALVNVDPKHPGFSKKYRNSSKYSSRFDGRPILPTASREVWEVDIGC